jgi:hypothetical protein
VDSIKSLEAALAQQEQEQEPVVSQNTQEKCRIETVPAKGGLLSIHPPRRETEQEPVAVHQFREANSAVWYDGHADHDDGNGPYEERVLYTHPPRREWVSLTEEEVWSQYQTLWPLPVASDTIRRLQFRKFARSVEQALKEKNHE